MKIRPLLIISFILTAVHYFLEPPRYFWWPLVGWVVNFIFIGGLLYFQQFKRVKYLSTLLFILTFIQLVYFFHYRSFIPLTAYEFILNEPRMLEEVFLMAKAQYFILPAIVLFFLFQRLLNKLCKSIQFNRKKIIPTLGLITLLISLTYNALPLERLGVLPFTSNYIAQTIAHPLFPYEKNSLKKNSELSESSKKIKNLNFNILIVISDALRMDALSASNKPEVVVDEKLQGFYKSSFIFNYTVSPSNMTDSSIPGFITSKATHRNFKSFRQSNRLWDFFEGPKTFYLSTADIQFSSLDESIKTRNLNLIDDLENIQKNLPLVDILKNGDQLFLPHLKQHFNTPFVGIWHMDGTHSYLYPPSTPLPNELKGYPKGKKKNYLHSISQMSDTLSKTLSKDLLKNTIVIFTSDHGEGFGEHGAHFHFKDFHQESIRVPLMIYLPEKLKSKIGDKKLRCLKENTNKISSTIDVIPTLLGVLDFSSKSSFDGRDLTKCKREKRIVGSTNCLTGYQCFNEDFMLANDDYYAIFSRKNGLIGVYDTWNDLKQRRPIKTYDKKKWPQFKTMAINYLQKLDRQDLADIVEDQLLLR